jgi:anaerobic ribonucleoside-triphosphate reductase activating protein
MINYKLIRKYDISNGDGIRVSIFFCGCHFHCKECFNEELQDFNYGQNFTNETLQLLIELGKPDYIKGYSILGGEPLDQNLDELENILKTLKSNIKNTNKTIWMWSGWKYENLSDRQREIVNKYVDVLVDGQFVKELFDVNLKFKGSSNQRLIDIKETNKNKSITLI